MHAPAPLSTRFSVARVWGPQVLLGTDRRYTTAVDCYGFGVVVSEMLCRTQPFAGHDTNFMDISERHVRPGLPDTSLDLVRHCQQNKGACRTLLPYPAALPCSSSPSRFLSSF